MNCLIWLKRFVTAIRNIRFSKIGNLLFHIKIIREFVSLEDKSNSILKGNGYDLFILSSCINPNDNIDFVNYSQPLSELDRFFQVSESVKSIRNFFPKAKIVYLDNSKISKYIENDLTKLVDEYHNYSQVPLMAQIRKIHNKGIAWSLTNFLFLISRFNNCNFKSIHFLNGRYQITPKVVLNSSGMVDNYLYVKFKEYNISTIYLVFNNVDNRKIIKYFRRAFYFSLAGYSVEDVFAISRFRVKYIKELGVIGNINGSVHNYE